MRINVTAACRFGIILSGVCRSLKILAYQDVLKGEESTGNK
jgi:hypothetical protein